MSTVELGSPLWWLVKLERPLLTRRTAMKRMVDYYDGDHPLPFLTRSHDAKMRNEFRQLLDDSRSNFMRPVVDVVEERLSVDGFVLSAETDQAADEGAWRIWQANQMDAQSQTAFQQALVKGVSYLSVWGDADGDGYPDIAVEDPFETIVAYEPGSNFLRRTAAVKVWKDEIAGFKRANVYLPNGVWKFRGADQPFSMYDPSRSELSLTDGGWEEMPNSFVRNTANVVPIIPLRNRPSLLREGESELVDVFRLQNQINGFNFLLALAGYFGAHKQRWAVGLTLMEDKNGKGKEMYDVAIDRLIVTDNKDAKFGEFDQTDLGGYIKAIEQKVQHIASTTRTPRHYLIEQGQSPSGDAIQSAESGLVKKVIRKQRTFGEGLEEAMRLARLFAGEKNAPVDSEIVWASAMTEATAAVTDATIKQYQSQLIPMPVALERLGYSQTQIRKIMGAPKDLFATSQADAAAFSEGKITGGLGAGA